MGRLFALCSFAVLSYLMHIIAHELGHLIIGLITGWRFVALQVFYIAITKDKALQIKCLPSLSCQCVMSPKTPTQSSVLYTLGGLIMNLIITLVCLWGLMKNSIGELVWIFSFCSFACGLLMLILNGIPGTKGVCNDMACLLLCIKEKNTKYYHNIQLMTAGQLSKGLSYRQCGQVLGLMRPGKKGNDIIAYQTVLEFYYYLDCTSYSLAENILKRIDLSTQVSLGIRKIIKLEVLFLDMLMGILHKDVVEPDRKSYDFDIDGYIRKHDVKGDVHAARVKAVWAAYQNYMDGDIPAGIRSLDQAVVKLQAMECLYPGEKLFCLDQLIAIRNIFWRDSVKMDLKTPESKCEA